MPLSRPVGTHSAGPVVARLLAPAGVEQDLGAHRRAGRLSSQVGGAGGSRLRWRPAHEVTAGGTPPAEWRANRLLHVPARVRNTSPATWPARGATRVALAYHWLDTAGQPVAYEGLRTALPHDVAPGETIAVELEIATPKKPGDYILELDALRERLAWFSGRRPDATRRVPVTVLPSDDR